MAPRPGQSSPLATLRSLWNSPWWRLLAVLALAAPSTPSHAQEPGPHQHVWEPFEGPHGCFAVLKPGTPDIVGYARVGSVVELQQTSDPDYDLCVNPEGICEYADHIATVSIHKVTWSDNGFGGQFGFINGSGE